MASTTAVEEDLGVVEKRFAELQERLTSVEKAQGGDKPEEVTQVKQWEADFKEYLEKDQLELYTCLALQHGVKGIEKAPKMIVGLLVCLLMQLGIPFMMLSYGLDEIASDNAVTDFRFRATGFAVYLYSLKQMHDSAVDECRELMLKIACEYPLPWHYLWPALLGEFINTITSLAMALTLFVNFLQQDHPADLVINAVSLNFLGNIDNEIIDDTWKAQAEAHFDQLVEEGPQEVQNAEAQQKLVQGACLFLFWFRIVLTVFGGIVLAFVFLFSKEHAMAYAMCDVIPWVLPWC